MAIWARAESRAEIPARASETNSHEIKLANGQTSWKIYNLIETSAWAEEQEMKMPAATK